MDSIIRQWLKGLTHALIDFIYPPLCRHCQSLLDERSHLLCAGCTPYLELTDPHSTCAYCVKPVEGRSVCAACIGLRVGYRKASVACTASGPASTLLRQFHQADPQLKTPMGSLMAMQVLQQNRPLPDVIVPLPGLRLTKVKRGFDGTSLLAAQIAEIIDRPVIRALARALVPQEGASFRLKSGARICDLRVMLVVDRFEQQEASQAAHELSKGFPLEIDVIGFL